MRKILAAMAGFVAVGAAVPAQAEVIYYQQGFSNNIFTYDTVTMTETLLGSTGLNSDSTGMAFASNGTLYAFERQSQSLYTVNTTTGAASLVGASGIDAEDLAISLDGTTGYATASGGLYSINLATGAATLIGGGQVFDGLTTARTSGTLGGNAYAAGALFAVDSGSLYSIDPLTGAASFIGNTTGADETFDFGFGGVLYGHGDDGFLYTIDATTLAATQLAPTTPQLVFGMAVGLGSGAVPEPSAWALLILGFGAVGGALRRSRKPRVALTYA